MWPTGGEKLRLGAVPSKYSKAAVRVSLVHFFIGKAVNASVTLLTLVALARWMDADAYGAYIAFLALQTSLLAVSSLGIDTTAERFMPELRIRHADAELLGFVMGAAGARFASLLLLAVIVLIAAEPITLLVGIGPYLPAFKVWVAVVVLTGLQYFVVASLEAMLHQRHAQFCMSSYVLSKFVLLGLAHQYLQLGLGTIVRIELIATGLSALVGAWLLLRRFAPGGLRTGWRILLANSDRMRRFAFYNYLAQVVFQFFSAETMKLLVTRLLGTLQSARYGFASSLAETVQRYLPAVLLLRLIKPIFVSRYTTTGDFAQLNAMARIILKLNLLILAPVIAFSAVFGADMLTFLSAGKYGDAQWILVGVLALLVLSSHQLVLSLLAGTIERNAMQLYAGIASAVAFPCAILLVPDWGPLGAVAASATSAIIYNTFATLYLRRAGFDYRPDFRGASAFLAGGVAMYGSILFLNRMLNGWTGMVVALTAGCILYLAIVRAMSGFSQEERKLLNSVLPKPVFIF